MREEILLRAEEYLARRRHRMRMLRAFTAMALVVAIMTSYVLMLPGLTMQSEAYCGLDEHTHDDSCYTLELICEQEEREPSESVVRLLQCAFQPHEHTDACRAEDGSIGCGISTSYWHSHSAECYDEAGALVCQLKSNPRHQHNDSCYGTLETLVCTTEESAGHVHDAACFAINMEADAVCGMEESAGHVHTEDCSVTTTTLTCDIPEATMTDLGGHVHTDACYLVQTEQVCGMAEGEGAHAHTEACYPVSEEPTCGLNEGDGAHEHGEGCYEYSRGDVTCDLLHEHSTACYDPETNLVICGEVYIQEHNHSSHCLYNVTAIEEGHAHSDACFEKNYSCTLEEHVHVAACYDAPVNDSDEPEVEETDPVSTTYIPTAEPTAEVTAEPTAEPTTEVTAEPTAEPTAEVTAEPTAEPTAEVTAEPTAEPTAEVTAEPTVEPTAEVTAEPTAEPTAEVTAEPTAEPTAEVTAEPTIEVTVEPTAEPTAEVTAEPTAEPTAEVTAEPTAEPTTEVTAEPTVEPTAEVTAEPTAEPTTEVTTEPTAEPTAEVTAEPTAEPTAEVTAEPTAEPTAEVTAEPTTEPTAEVTAEPTAEPTAEVTAEPTAEPTAEVTAEPTAEPTAEVTAEPTAEPTAEVTAEPTAVPTAEVTAEPTAEPTTEVTADPTAEPTAEVTAEPTAEVTAEPTAEPTAEVTAEPTAEPTAEVTAEPTAEPTAEVTVEPTAEPTQKPTGGLVQVPSLDVVAPAYSCGLAEHLHDDACYDESGALVCGYENEHEHTLDCQCACGIEEHYHTDACYDEAGEVVCGIEEHRHVIACDLNAESKVTAEEVNNSFAPYIADSKWNTADGVSIKNGTDVIYDPESDSFTTTLQIDFAIPNYVLRGYSYWNGWYWVRVPGQQEFTYLLPSEIKVTDSMIDKPFAITSPDGKTIEGTFYIKKTEDGRLYLDIEFSDDYVRTANAGYSMPGWPINQTPYSQGNISFGCSIGSEAAQDDGSIRIEFTQEDVLEIPPKEIEYPDNETATANIATEKRGSYVREGNKLVYTVLVHSDKGTPSHVKVDDKLIFNGIEVESFGTPVVKSYTSTWNGNSWNKDGNETNVSVVSGGPAEVTSTTASYKQNQGPAGDIKLDMHLPKINDPGDGKRFTYEITYEINLEDVGLDFNGNGTNTVHVKSESGAENKVEASASSNVGIYVDSLSKVGSYDQKTDKIKWTITVNGSYQDINGAVLTDQMFTTISEADLSTIVVKDASGNVLSEGNGFQINTADGKVSSIEFFGTSMEDGKEVNRNKYVVEYYTTPTKSSSEYTETNDVTLKTDDDESKEQGGAYVKRDLRVYKQNTGATNEGTDRIIDWKSGFTVFDAGLTEDLVIKDTISGENHYMSADQVMDLYDSIRYQRWFSEGAGGAMTLTAKDADGNTVTVSAADLAANPSAYADYQFTEFTYTIAKDKLPADYKGQTIEITYQSTADVSGLNGTATYSNGWGVGHSNTGANHTYTQTEIIKVDKLNYWDSNDEANIETTTGIVEWHVNVTQDKTYNYITITDTLPPETKLAYLKFGQYGSTTIALENTEFAENSSTPINLVVNNYDYHEQGVRISGTYTPSTGAIVLKVEPAPGADSGMLDRALFGEGKTFKLRVFAELKDEYMKDLDEGETESIGRITNNVNVATNEGNYGDDEHSYNVTVKGTAKVTKTDGNNQSQDTTVNNQTGELSWRVKVTQNATYDYLEIVDTLPEGVELVNAKIGRYTETTATYDATTADSSGNCTLSFSIGGNDKGLKYSGTYNVNTRVVTIKVQPSDDGQTSDVYGEGKTYEVLYNCKVNDDLMPDTENGEYKVELGKLVNNVTVNTEEGEYDSDSQGQTVTVEKEKPIKETVGKDHKWTPSMNLLSYSVDLNPTAADLDPSKNMLTVTDKLTYVKDPDNYDRQLALIKSSVKLFYADYDANGNPLRDENGKLIKGQQVPYSDWTMSYSSNVYENNWQQSDCTMVLTVPDERALILEYDYRVSMKYVPGWDNELRLTNTVCITGYDEQQESTDWTDKWEEYNAGGIVSTERSLSIVKFDASNHAKLIEGAVFTVYEYSSETNEWFQLANYVTDGNGNLMVQWQQSEEDVQYKENTAYKIVETQPAMGYILDPNAEPIYFYWANATVSTSSLPDKWVATYDPRELVTNPGAVEVDNIRKTTEVAVTKIWDVEDDSLIPDSLTVHLKRYAIPTDVWEAHPEYNHGLSSTIVSVKGDLKTANTSDIVPSFSVLCYAGSTVSFDLKINSQFTEYGWGNSAPVFRNMPDSSTITHTRDGNYVTWHYEMEITESVNLDGIFQSGWDGSLFGSGWNYDIPVFSNVTVTANTGEGTLDDGDFSADLDPYRDRNYTNTMTLTEAGNWAGLWENLDLIGTDANGNEVHYKYYVVEDVPNGFASTITGGSSDISGSFEAVNTYDESRTETTDVKVIKLWQDANGDVIDPLLDSVEVRLYQKDELTGREIVYPYKGFPTTVLNAATDWTFYFRDLPYGTWDKDGNVTSLYSYRIEEVTKDPSFITQIVAVNAAGVEVLNEELIDATVTVINSERHKVSVTVYKEFESTEGHDHTNCEVTVQLDRYVLTQDGYILDTTHTPVTQVLSAANQWAYTWENLDDADAEGNGYQYRVTETLVNGVPVAESGYIPVYSTTDGSIPNDGEMTITNELPSEMKVTKEWTDLEGNPVGAPAGANVTLELWRTTVQQISPLDTEDRAYDPTVDPGTSVDELVTTFTLNAGCNWEQIFKALPAASLSGEAYHYYVKEIAVEGYTTEYIGNYTSNEGEIIVRNMRDETEITYIKINKIWTDAQNKPVEPKGYTEAYFKLYKDGTDITATLNSETNGVTPVDGYIPVTKDAGWALTINGLDAEGTYKIVEFLKNNGQYTLVESAAYAPQEGPAGTSFNVTNRLTEITIEKVWKDVNGNTLTMPNDRTVTMELYCRKVDGTEIKLFDVVLPVQQADGSYQWKKTVEDLTAGKADAPVTYFFKEQVPEGFDVSYSNSTDGVRFDGKNEGTITVTNTQQEVSFSLVKVWKDKSGNVMETAPTGVSIAFNLMRVGTGVLNNEDGSVTYIDEVIDTIYLPSENGWQGSFKNLPRTDLNGKAYEYYIQENSSNGMNDYVVTYDPAGSGGNRTSNLQDQQVVTVTNQLQQKEIKLNIMKRWSRGSDAKDVTINLYRYILTEDGQKIVDPTYVTALTFKVDDTATYQTVGNLPDYGAFQKDGQNYEGDFHYFVEEQNISEDYTVTYSNDDGTTTVVNPQDASLDHDGNLRVINHERAKLNVQKAWNTENRKDSISFDLYRKEIPASAIDVGTGETEFVDVTFRVVVMNQYTGSDGQTVSEEALLSSVTKTFRKGAQVKWNAVWSTDWTWHPTSNQPPQSVVYKTNGGLTIPITFDTGADNDTASPYEYTFDVGYMADSGTVTWTTNNWYQNGGSDNGRWAHSFVVDGIAESSTYSLRATSREIGDPPVKIGTFTLNGGSNAMQTATMEIEGVTYTYEIHDGDWSMLFYDLPVWSEDEESAFVYYVEELTDEYLVSYTNNGGIQSGTITITNSDKETEVAEVTVTKAYAEGSPSTPAVDVELYRSVTDGNNTYIERVGSATLSADNSWTYKWTDLLKGGTITQEGTPITGTYTYFVQEVVPTGFTAVYSTTDGVVGFTEVSTGDGKVLSGTVNITNVPKTGLTVKKVWDTTPADEIEFALKRTETVVGDTSNMETVTITFQMVIDYEWEEESTGIWYPDRMTLATHTETFLKGATVDWKPTWTNTNDDWHPTSGVITYNGNPIAFKPAVNNVDEYAFTFHLGQVNESGTVIWAMDNWFWDDPDAGYNWEHAFNKNAGNTLNTYKLNADNNWQMTFYDLPAESTDGLYTYGYEVEELTSDYAIKYNYETQTNEVSKEIEGTITITNSEKPPETTFVRAEKKWVTTESTPPEVTVRLYRRITETQLDADGEEVEVTLEELASNSEVKLNDANGWDHSWNNLLCEGTITKDGKTVTGRYAFRIEEIVPDGYEVSYSRQDGKVPNAGTVVITNTEVTEIGVEKEWVNQDASTAPEVEFELIQKATPVDGILNDPNYPMVDVKLQITNAGPDEWQAEFFSTRLTAKREAEITWNLWYTSNWGAPGEGDNNGGYLLAPDGKQYEIDANGRSYTIKFPASASGTYFWVTGGWFPDDSFNGASDAHATWNSSTSVAEPSLNTKETTWGTYKLNAENGWRQDIGSLPKKDADGLYTFSYYVKETNPLDGFAIQYGNNGGIITGDITITNIRHLAHINVVKQYADGSSTTPAVDVDLVRSVTQNGVTLEETVDTINLSASNNWRHTWGDLPQSGSITADGVTVGGEYTYYVREKAPLGFSVAYSPNEDGSAPLNGTVFITNTEQSQLKVEKVWGDGAEEQEIQFKLWRRRTENTNPATCPECGQQVGTETAHAAKCGTAGHYTCDGDTHTVCTYCGNGFVCEGGHGSGVCTAPTCPSCGSDVSSTDEHKASCGNENHYTCDSYDHTMRDCGHYKCSGDSLDHSWCSFCNQWSCNGSNHGNGVCNGSGVIKCPNCNNVVNNANDHVGACGVSGHYTCWGGNHGAAQCGTAGHYACDGKDHWNADCGISGHYKCDGKDHNSWCYVCNKTRTCDGEHGEGICNAIRCAECNEKVDDVNAHKGACGHYTCASGYNAAEHTTCSICGRYICNGKTHGQGSCDAAEFVDITFGIFNGNPNWNPVTEANLAKRFGPVSVEVGSTITWTASYSAGWYPDVNAATLEYPGGSVKLSLIGTNPATYQLEITVEEAGEVKWILGNTYNDGTWTSTFGSSTYSLTSASRSVDSLRLTGVSRASEVVDTTGATDMGTFTLNSANDWEYIFYELPQYSTDGKYVYEYFVQEITEGYDVSYTNNAGITEGEITITNSKHVPTTIDVPVTKLWVDESGNAYLLLKDTERYFKVFNGTEDYTASVTSLVGAELAGEYIKLITEAGANSASFTIEDLPIGGTYTIREYMLVGEAYVEVADYVTEGENNSFTITNKLTDITVNKTWAPLSDGSTSYARPDVTFELWRTYAGGTDEMVEAKVMKAPSTVLTWDMLPLTVDGTTPYQYYVKELLPAGFTAANAGSVDVAQGAAGSITNTPTELKVEKEWQTLDGDAITRTEGTVYYKIMRQKVTVSNGTETLVGDPEAYTASAIALTAEKNWQATHTLLPLYWKDDSNNTSGEYRYFVVETDANGNEVHAQYSNTNVDVSTLQTITIINTETEITVKKIWSVNGGMLPETLPEITLQLRYTYTQGTLADSDPIVETIKLTADTEGVTVTSDAEGNVFWTYTWDELVTHDLVEGIAKPRYYYVVESETPADFRQSGTDINNFGITGNTTDNPIQITNELIAYELPETGGIGTTPYTLCGMLLLVGAAVLMYKDLQRKKQWGEGRES
ncbi:MAG: Cna B-type domain-containing protein [Clostridiales bacterium]|nr:Cna B-type domain-containing protein [Clostridiales bacterium]